MNLFSVIRPGAVRYMDPEFEQLLLSLRRGAMASGPAALVFTGMPKAHLEAQARQVATRLGRPLIRLDLARVLGKYIGETEKNLDQLLRSAEASGAVLLLDEADALFGNRTDAKDSNDKYANLETNYLLSKLEQFRGVIVITSNAPAEAVKPRGKLRQVAVKFPPAR